MRNRQFLLVPQCPDAAGTTECVVGWVGNHIRDDADLARAARPGAEAMAYSLSRASARDSSPYRSDKLFLDQTSVELRKTLLFKRGA